jgi:hypothetical protein
MWKVEPTHHGKAIGDKCGDNDGKTESVASSTPKHRGKHAQQTDVFDKFHEELVQLARVRSIAALCDKGMPFGDRLRNIIEHMSHVGKQGNNGTQLTGAVKRRFGGPHGAANDESDNSDEAAGAGGLLRTIDTSSTLTAATEGIPLISRKMSKVSVKPADPGPEGRDNAKTDGDSMKLDH